MILFGLAIALASTSTTTTSSTSTDTEIEIEIEDTTVSEPGAPKLEPRAPPPPPPPPVSIEARANVRFEARSSVDLSFEQPGEQVATFGIGGRLELEVDLTDWLSAFAAPAAFFEFSLLEGGGDRRALFLNVPEGWVRASAGPLDLRFGAIVFNWGTSDLIAPNDVLNPVDYRRNIVASAEDTKIPVIAAEAVLRLDPLTLRAVIEPFFTGSKYFVAGWDSSLIAAPLAERLPVPPQAYEAIEAQLGEIELEPSSLTAGGRAELHIGDLDLAFNGVYGWDPLPVIDLRQSLEVNFARREVFGLEATLLIDPVILRLDSAFSLHRTLYTQALQPVRHPWLNVVLGGEYAYGDDFRLVLELFVIAIFDVQDRLLLFEELSADPATDHTVALPGAAAFIRYAILGGDLKFEVGGLTTPTRGDVVVLPAIRYRFFDEHQLSLAATIIQGKDDSYGGAYDHNDEIYLQYRWEK